MPLTEVRRNGRREEIDSFTKFYMKRTCLEEKTVGIEEVFVVKR